MTTQTTIGIRLDPETKQRLVSLGNKRDRSPHYLMKKAIERYLEIEESREEDIKIMNQRWNNFALTGESVKHSEVKNWASEL